MYKTYADAIYAAAAEEGLVEYVDAVLPKAALTGNETSQLWEFVKASRSKGLPNSQYEAEYQKLVLDRLPYAFHTALKYRGHGVPLEDLFQEAVLVVMDFFGHSAGPANQIAARTSMLLKARLETIVASKPREVGAGSIFDIAFSGPGTPKDMIEELYNTQEGKTLVRDIFKTLAPVEEKIIRLRYGFGLPEQPETQGVEFSFKAISEILRKISPHCERSSASISHIHTRAIYKLRHPVRSRPLKAAFY